MSSVVQDDMVLGGETDGKNVENASQGPTSDAGKVFRRKKTENFGIVLGSPFRQQGLVLGAQREQ